MNEVLMAAQSGSVSAINQLLVESERYVRSIVSNYLGTKYANRVDIDDVCQEVLLKVATDVARCRATDWKAYLGWLASVARNTTYSTVRYVKRKKDSADETVTIGEYELPKGDTPDEIAVATEQAARFLQLADQMGERTKIVAEMLMAGASIQEISESTGLTHNAISCVAYRYRTAVAAIA